MVEEFESRIICGKWTPTVASPRSGTIVRECHRLALKTGDQSLITEAEASLAMVAGLAKESV
jgi:hypothetical protein